MRIKSKLTIVCSIVAFFTLAIGFVSISELNNIIYPWEHGLADDVRKFIELCQIRQNLILVQTYDNVLSETANKYVHTQDPDLLQGYQGTKLALDNLIKSAVVLDNDDDDKLFQDISKLRQSLTDKEQASFDLANQGHVQEAIGLLASDGYLKQHSILRNNLASFIDKKEMDLDVSMASQSTMMEQLLKQTDDSINKNKVIISITMPVILGILFLLIFIFSKRLLKPLTDLKESALKISKGNLGNEIKVTSNDEIGDLAKEFENMRRSVKSHILLHSIMERRYRAFYEETPILNRSVTRDGVIIDCNQRYARELGYSKEEIIGCSIFDHTAQKGFDKMMNEFKNWRKTGSTIDDDIWLQRKDGTVFPVMYHSVNLYDENNVIVGRIASMINMSDLYAAQSKIQEYNQQIEDHLKELQEKDRQKEEFSSMISHELKTPLVPIRGYSEMLQDPGLLGGLNAAQLNAVKVIHEASIMLENMISNILDVHKIDIKELKFNKETVVVDKFMEKIFANFMPLMNKQKIDFVNSANNKSNIIADTDRLTQVISNLINNAAEFVPKENGRIEIGAKGKDASVVLYVKDNGIGIPKEKQATLFKKFYQVDCSHRRTHRGTGLGLAICKGIVEELGGTITVESELGNGTTFLISLPKAENQVTQNLNQKLGSIGKIPSDTKDSDVLSNHYTGKVISK